jgi:hypothetical protein
MADLLHLLYEDGDKTKPLSPMVTNEKGVLVGRNLGKNNPRDISEWASMVYYCAGKKIMCVPKYNNSYCRKYKCKGCNDSTLLTTSMLLPFILLLMYVLISVIYVLIAFLPLMTCRK